MIEALVIAVLIAGVLFSLARPRGEDEEPAFLESGVSHLSPGRKAPDARHRR